MKYYLILILFLCNSCTTLSYKDVSSHEYGIVLYKVISSGRGSTYINFGSEYATRGIYKYPDPNIESLPHREKTWQDSEDYYYRIEYIKPGIYPIKLMNTFSYIPLPEYEEVITLPNLGCVEILGGVINYIGDYYWDIGSREDFKYESLLSILTRTRSATTVFAIKDNYRRAVEFMAQYYPKYDFPIVNQKSFKGYCPS